MPIHISPGERIDQARAPAATEVTTQNKRTGTIH